MNDEINHLRFALADTEALCLQHEEVITRLRADLKAATNERDAYHERLTELREELADAKQDKARLVNLLEEPNGILGSGFLPLDWRDDIRAALDDAKEEE